MTAGVEIISTVPNASIEYQPGRYIMETINENKSLWSYTQRKYKKP